MLIILDIHLLPWPWMVSNTDTNFWNSKWIKPVIMHDFLVFPEFFLDDNCIISASKDWPNRLFRPLAAIFSEDDWWRNHYFPLDGTDRVISRKITGYTTIVENLKIKYYDYFPGNNGLSYGSREFENHIPE